MWPVLKEDVGYGRELMPAAGTGMRPLRAAGDDAAHGRAAELRMARDLLWRAEQGTQRGGPETNLAAQQGWDEELAVAVAYAAMAGAMVARGRLEEAEYWLGHAGRALQPDAEPTAGLNPPYARGGPQMTGGGGEEILNVALVCEVLTLLTGASEPSPSPGPQPSPGEPVTRSEIRVLCYLPSHMSLREIAGELYISVNTVKTHVRHLYQKLGAGSRGEAVDRARACGLLTGSSRRLSNA
jgi:DNA-binding CsgD family transcriptional regulator